MKIAMISSPYIPVPPKKYGGTERVIYYLIKWLKELGHEPVLIGPGDSEVDCEIIPICDHSINFGKTPEEQSILQIQVEAAIEKTEEILRKIAPQVDIVHSHGYDLKGFGYVPNITTLHGPFDLSNMDYYHERDNLYYASISHNQQIAFPGLHYAGNCYNSLDPDEFPLQEVPEDYLCFIGRFDIEKQPHLAVQLALQLGIKLKMAGKIDFFGCEYFDREIKPYLDHPLIEYLGELDLPAKYELMSHARCNLHPTGFREPFGLTVLEAAYCGTPTLAIRRGAMSELIEDGRTGLLVEDFEEWYHKVRECFKMDRSYISRRAKGIFNYHNMATDYLKAYNNVLRQFYS